MVKATQPWKGRQGSHKGILLVMSLSLSVYLLCSESMHADDDADFRPIERFDSSASRRLSGQSHSGSALAGSSSPGVEGSNLTAHVSCGENGNISCNSGSAEQHEHAHQYDAMLFLFDAFVVGAFVLNLLTKVSFLQETVVLFTLGLIYSLVVEGLDLQTKMKTFGTSYDMWMAIDPHTLLFTMLPALLAGDAMSIDTSVAKTVAKQCLYLAGPGVLINAFVAACFLKWFLGWSFLLSMVTGSILCATDPVAVVALLKELGASPVLTVQIQGESLLNDGTAIVLYMVSYDMLKGREYDIVDIVTFLVQKAFLAWGMGIFIGYFFFTWIRLASNKLEHHSSMIQITLTICCAYWSFIMAEGVWNMSGVLSTVAASLVLAHHMWPFIVSPESMHHVWHTLEALGNIILFFLAGALTGNVMVTIENLGMNFLRLIVIYIVMTLVRGSLIFASRPLLRLLSADRQPVSLADCAVMTWGGLRGAVGLALAILVKTDMARRYDDESVKEISKDEAEQVIFFVAGIAFLTTIVNATTCPHLVNYLEITALPHTQQRLLKMFTAQIRNWAMSKSYPKTVTENLQHMLDEICDDIRHTKVRKARFEDNCQTNDAVIQLFHEARDAYKQTRLSDTHGDLTLNLLGDLPHPSFLDGVDDLLELIRDEPVDKSMARTVNKAFLNIVNAHYWKQIELGNLRAGTPAGDTLLTSIRVTPLHADLLDFDFVCDLTERHMSLSKQTDESLWRLFNDSDDTKDESSHHKCQRRFIVVVNSCFFQVFIGFAILLNGLYVAIDEGYRNPHEEDIMYHPAWLYIEGFFATLFFLEFVVKFIAMHMQYFNSAWNIFDFSLVWLGVFGFILSLEVYNSRAGEGEASQVLRISRVFRLSRFLRIIRLFHHKLGVDKHVSPLLTTRLHRVVTLLCFVHSHLSSETDLVKYFGGNNKVDEKEECEIARCIVQSQTAVYKAFAMITKLESTMSEELLAEMRMVQLRKNITEGLEKFIMDAYEHEAISARETEQFLHPIHHFMGTCMKEMQKCIDPTTSLVLRVSREVVPKSVADRNSNDADHDVLDVVTDKVAETFTAVVPGHIPDEGDNEVVFASDNQHEEIEHLQ